MRFEFRLPDIGEGMVEGEIAKWHVKVGDTIREDEPMLDIMTDKATVTVSAPKAGKVLEIGAKEGEVKKVGTVLIVMEVEGSSEPIKQRLSHEPPSNGGNSRQEVATSVAAAAPTPTSSGGARVQATPATRRLAQDLGVDLSLVRGSGPGGRITPEDVKSFAQVPRQEGRGSTLHPVASGSTLQDEHIPFRGLRRKIAEKMTASKTKIPHFTYVEEADVSELVTLRDKAESAASHHGIKLTYLPFIIKATVHALKKYPMLNSVLDEEKQEILVKRHYNIGIGAATPEGLTVPVLKAADQKTIFEIGKEVNDLGEKARAGKLSMDELQGSTFTITSLGPLGGMFATPIINYPEVAILGIHRIQKRPVVRHDQIVIRDMMYVSLSFDHRVIDGDVGAKFANEVISILECPSLLLVE